VTTTGSGRPCTTFEAVLVVLWQCRVRATMLPGSGRPRFSSRSPLTSAGTWAPGPGYYSNCVANQPLSIAVKEEHAEAFLGELARQTCRE